MSPVRDEPPPQSVVVPTVYSPEERRVLSDPKIQEQYRQAYNLQQARRSCPGCGESSLSF
jgi:hypothetical protein